MDKRILKGKLKYEGLTFKTKGWGDVLVLEYNGALSVDVKFVDTGYTTTTRIEDLNNGTIKDYLKPSVFGVGITGTKYPTNEGGVNTKEYALWKNMLKRCYSDTCKKKQPTLEDCEVSENFKYYEYFYDWCQNQVGFGNQDWQLDKDLLIKGNKVYSEDSCVFMPQEINSLLVKCTASRGEYLIGVCWHNTNKAFRAMVRRNKGKREHLGYFKTELEAFNAYKTAKESFVKEQANEWKGKIDHRAYEALMNYTVEITD